MAQPLQVRVKELAALHLAQGFAVAEHALTRWAQRVFERACADDGHDPAAPAAGAEPAWLARLKAELTGLTASAKGHMQGADEAWDMSTVSQVVDKMLQFRARYAQLAGLSDDDAQALHRLTERAAQTRHLVAHGGTPVDQLVGGGRGQARLHPGEGQLHHPAPQSPVEPLHTPLEVPGELGAGYIYWCHFVFEMSDFF